MNKEAGNQGLRFKNIYLLIFSMKPYWLEMACTLLTTFFKHVTTIGIAAIASYMVALAMLGRLKEQFTPLFACLCAGILIRALMYYGEMWFGHDVAYRVLKDFRLKLYDAIEAISPAFLINRIPYKPALRSNLHPHG